MKVVIFVVQYKGFKKFDNSYKKPIPIDFTSDVRNSLFDNLIKKACKKNVDLAVLPGGFFRTDSPGGIANGLKHHPPKITVVVGWDNVLGSKSEAWVIDPDGVIKVRYPEAWKSPGNFNKKILSSINDRTFDVREKKFAVFCCGDVLIDNKEHAGRKPPIFDSRAAFVLAHSSASGQSFTPAMRKLVMPVFLSQHVKWPSLKNNEYFAYNGKKPLEPIDEFEDKRSQSLKWIARIYSI